MTNMMWKPLEGKLKSISGVEYIHGVTRTSRIGNHILVSVERTAGISPMELLREIRTVCNGEFMRGIMVKVDILRRGSKWTSDVWEVPARPTNTIDPATGKEAGKTPFSLVHFPFVAAMARALREGLKNGRKRDDWKGLDWTPEIRTQYVDAWIRHTVEEPDPVASALNAMIIHYHDGRAK